MKSATRILLSRLLDTSRLTLRPYKGGGAESTVRRLGVKKISTTNLENRKLELGAVTLGWNNWTDP